MLDFMRQNKREARGNRLALDTSRSWIKVAARYGWIFSQCVLLVVLLVVAWHLKSPHLLKLRVFEIPVLLVISVGWAWRIRSVLRQGQQTGIALLFHQLVLLLLALVVGLSLWGAGRLQWHKYQVQQAPAQELAALGSHLLLGYESLEAVLPWVRSGAIGGVYLTRRNIRGKSAAEIQAEVAMLQEARRAAGFETPLWVATDQEGGVVSRMSPPLRYLPSLAHELAQVPAENRAAVVREYAQSQGQALSGLGINLNFAPVVDLRPEHAPDKLDFHSLIGQRAIAADPRIVSQVATIYVQALEQAGVLATLKHFPGLGSVRNDTHHFPAVLDADVSVLAQRDWLPFRQTLAASHAFMMLGHVTLPSLDAQQPASRSSNVIQSVIRQHWQHQGVLITDDLSMGAFYYSWQGIEKSAVQALNAGVDILLIAYDVEKFYPVMSALLTAKREGLLPQALLDRSQRRIEQPMRAVLGTH